MEFRKALAKRALPVTLILFAAAGIVANNGVDFRRRLPVVCRPSDSADKGVIRMGDSDKIDKGTKKAPEAPKSLVMGTTPVRAAADTAKVDSARARVERFIQAQKELQEKGFPRLLESDRKPLRFR